jgi:hypothetical protein
VQVLRLRLRLRHRGGVPEEQDLLHRMVSHRCCTSRLLPWHRIHFPYIILNLAQQIEPCGCGVCCSFAYVL